MKPDSQQHWFRAKRYGWGWGMATCWQGWVVYLSFFVLLLLGPELVGRRLYPLYALGLAAVLVALCWAKGEKPRWRWGNDSDD